MTDLELRMQELDHLKPPDLWWTIESRATRPRTLIQRILDSIRMVPRLQVAVMALALAALIAGGLVVADFGIRKIETANQPGERRNEKGDESGGGLQEPNKGPAGPGGQPTPGGSPAAGSSKGSHPEGTTPEGAGSQGFETAGPPVHYYDQADDAYGTDAAPNPALSQSALDIVRVDWGPVPFSSEDKPGGYFTSITVSGTARTDGAYTSWGEYQLITGEACQVYHSIIPGTTAYANALCGYTETGTRRVVGRIQGTEVTSTPTESGGTILSATFDNRNLPSSFQATGRTLSNLSAFTCMQRNGRQDCAWYDTLDSATSSLSYRV